MIKESIILTVAFGNGEFFCFHSFSFFSLSLYFGLFLFTYTKLMDLLLILVYMLGGRRNINIILRFHFRLSLA